MWCRTSCTTPLCLTQFLQPLNGDDCCPFILGWDYWKAHTWKALNKSLCTWLRFQKCYIFITTSHLHSPSQTANSHNFLNLMFYICDIKLNTAFKILQVNEFSKNVSFCACAKEVKQGCRDIFPPTETQASADPRSPCKGSGEGQRHESSFLSFTSLRKRQDIHKRTSHYNTTLPLN